MAASLDFASLDAAALRAEQQRLQRLVYSRQAESEPAEPHRDASTGQLMQIRENEWQLVQLEREVQRRAQSASESSANESGGQRRDGRPASIPDAAATASAPPQPFIAAVSLPRASALRLDAASLVAPPTPPRSDQQPLALPPPASPRRRHWLRAVLLFAAGIAVGTAATLSATGVAEVPGFAALAPSPPEPTTPSTTLPIPIEHAALLQIFTNAGTGSSTIPPALLRLFPRDGIALIYAPPAGYSGTRIYAARADLLQLCLVASIPTQQIVWRCGSTPDVARSGLHLRFWLPDGLQQRPTTFGDGIDHDPTIADAAWNPDGTFSVTQAPYG